MSPGNNARMPSAPKAVKASAILGVVCAAILGFAALALGLLFDYYGSTNGGRRDPSSVPLFVVLPLVVIVPLLASSIGTWMLKRWARRLHFVLLILVLSEAADILPGGSIGPSEILLVVPVVSLLLLLLPSSREAFGLSPGRWPLELVIAAVP